MERGAGSGTATRRSKAILAVIYLIFNEGYVVTSGDTMMHHELCSEAIRLCHILVDLMPGSAEAHGLLALMLLHDSRRNARLVPTGELVVLDEQDRTLWDSTEISEGVAALDKAIALQFKIVYDDHNLSEETRSLPGTDALPKISKS